MTLSLKQRAEEILTKIKHPGRLGNKTFLYDSEIIEQALQEVREEAIREAAKEFMCADVAFWTPKEAVKIILSLIPPKTGKP